ncbi:hypothetical protein T03_5660 [Trichinella britovi]|uniref:Uncharacterized protein n=1 Tax=Trichinella britovi TaxID=45882 RepID=A0A0V1ALC0_TRIBR|nr:hypothetical protein T03_5660 [Trichinella britovi]
MPLSNIVRISRHITYVAPPRVQLFKEMAPEIPLTP